MDLEPGEHMHNPFENDSLVRNLFVGGLVAIATVAARKSVERSWSAIYKKPPPNKRAADDADLKDAMMWAVLIGATTGLVRLSVRRAIRAKVK